MGQLHYITGAAGTGKTHKLTEALLEWFGYNTLLEHQTVLALTRMHGSRKRLRERLTSNSIHARISVSTVDSFALRLVNRWRLSLGFDLPILISEEGGFTKNELGYQATFEEVRECAANLSASPNVAKTIANSFPIILVDEFQDCTGSQLSLIKNLKNYVDLVIAADSFQALDGDESACNWVDELNREGSVSYTTLTEPRRTNCRYINEAANALRDNHPAIYSSNRLPFLLAPKYALAPWKVQPNSLRSNESAALLYPVGKVWINLINETTRQNNNRAADGRLQIRFPWRQRISDKDLEKRMYSDFTDAIKQGTWRENTRWQKLYEQAYYLAKIKGYSSPTTNLLEYVVAMFIQTWKYIDAKPIKYEATTVHGAKNREFNHVYVLWDNNLCASYSDEEKRRLLYNAITRAKTSCTVVAIGTKPSIMASPILSLLGVPVEPPKKKARK